MISKYPHTATISWLSAGTTNSLGVWTPGTLTTIHIACDAQPVSNRYVTGEGGARLEYGWDVYADRFSGDTTVPKTAKLTFFSSAHILVQLFTYQKHVEMKCQN